MSRERTHWTWIGTHCWNIKIPQVARHIVSWIRKVLGLCPFSIFWNTGASCWLLSQTRSWTRTAWRRSMHCNYCCTQRRCHFGSCFLWNRLFCCLHGNWTLLCWWRWWWKVTLRIPSKIWSSVLVNCKLGLAPGLIGLGNAVVELSSSTKKRWTCMSASQGGSGACRSGCMSILDGSSCRSKHNRPFHPSFRCPGFEIGSTARVLLGSILRKLWRVLTDCTLALGRLWKEEFWVHACITDVSPRLSCLCWRCDAFCISDFPSRKCALCSLCTATATCSLLIFRFLCPFVLSRALAPQIECFNSLSHSTLDCYEVRALRP